jgi:hypothetical protein
MRACACMSHTMVADAALKAGAQASEDLRYRRPQIQKTSDTEDLRYRRPQIQKTSDTEDLRYRRPQIQKTSNLLRNESRLVLSPSEHITFYSQFLITVCNCHHTSRQKVRSPAVCRCVTFVSSVPLRHVCVKCAVASRLCQVCRCVTFVSSVPL